MKWIAGENNSVGLHTENLSGLEHMKRASECEDVMQTDVDGFVGKPGWGISSHMVSLPT